MSRQSIVAGLALLLAMAPVVAGADFVFGPSGGNGGVAFQIIVPPGARVTEVRVWSGAWIDAIQIGFESADGKKKRQSLRFGGSGGELKVLNLAPGESIRAIQGMYGQKVDSLIIRTEGAGGGKKEFRAGGRGGTAVFNYEVIPGTTFAGFSGRSAGTVDAIGLILRK